MKTKSIDRMMTDFYKHCDKAGLSVTPQRLAVYRSLISADNHPSPETIYHDVKSDMPMISFATVYKTLQTFEEKGIIDKVTSIHNTVRYDPVTSHHHHVICTRCKRIYDIYSEELDSLKIPEQIQRDYDFLNYSVHFNVICPECRNKVL